jgi:hypothetical protein
MISSRYELAVTRYLAAKSGLYSEGERAALLYSYVTAKCRRHRHA